MFIEAAVLNLQHLLNSVGSNLLEFGEAFGKTAYAKINPTVFAQTFNMLFLICKFGLLS